MRSIICKTLLSIYFILGNLVKLKILDLRSNKLQILPNTIKNLQALEKLYLDNNYFTSLPYSIWPILETLQLLDWKDNPWNEESKEILKRDIKTVKEYCKKRASITIFISH